MQGYTAAHLCFRIKKILINKCKGRKQYAI